MGSECSLRPVPAQSASETDSKLMNALLPLPSFVLARDPLSPPAGLEGAVYVIGNFDGVHRGHRAVIDRARALAARLGKPCAMLTFEPHPVDYFAGQAKIFRLTPEPAKAQALSRIGLDGMGADFHVGVEVCHSCAKRLDFELTHAGLGMRNLPL